jgi:hypothetical protein
LSTRENRFREAPRDVFHLFVEEIETREIAGHLRGRGTFNERETSQRGGETEEFVEEEVFAIFLRRVGRGRKGWRRRKGKGKGGGGKQE